MATSTITSKGRITLPSEVRKVLGLCAGDKVDFVMTEDGYMLAPLRQNLSGLRGRFAGRVERPVTLDVMEAAIAQGATVSD